MKRLNNSQPLAVATQFRPLSDSFYIEVLGGMSTVQYYRQATNEWSPNHTVAPVIDGNGSQSDGVLRLAARYSIVDPNDIVDATTLSPQIFWFVDGTQITSNDVTADYYVQNNILYVRKNFTHLTGATVVCECRYTDTRTARAVVLSDTLPLSAVLQADEQWSLSLLCDRTRKHFPLFAQSTIYSFEAEAKLGSDNKNTDVAWFWDYSLDDGFTWRNIDASCYWYVSGKNSSTLRVDMDFIEQITVRVRLGSDTSKAAPDLPNFATASLAWRYPAIHPMVFSYGGNRVFAETAFMTFGVICHVSKHDDLTERQKREWLIFDWALRRQSSTTLTPLKEFQREVVVPGHKLFSTTNQKFIVDPRISMRGVYDIVADHTGNTIQTSSGHDIFIRT